MLGVSSSAWSFEEDVNAPETYSEAIKNTTTYFILMLVTIFTFEGLHKYFKTTDANETQTASFIAIHLIL